MHFLRSALLSAALLTLAAGSAIADAKTETQQLYKSVSDSAAIFIDALNDIGGAPKTAIPTIEQMVQQPVQKARFTWIEKMQAADNKAEYAPFLSCEGAGVALDDISSKYLRFLNEQDGAPDLKSDIKYFREDLAECEIALGLEPTFTD